MHFGDFGEDKLNLVQYLFKIVAFCSFWRLNKRGENFVQSFQNSSILFMSTLHFQFS